MLTNEFGGGGDNNIIKINTEDLNSIYSSTSKGNQNKWYDSERGIFVKQQFFYQNRYWKDYLVEVLASSIGEQLGTYTLKQNVCYLENLNTHGVYSSNFLAEDEVFVTFDKLIEIYSTQNIIKDYYRMSSEERLQFILEVYKSVCDINAMEYLYNISFIDLLILNEDRHLKNFGIIYNVSNKSFRIPPLFDFGLGLFEHDEKYIGLPYINSIRKVRSKFISSNHEKALKVFGIDNAYSGKCVIIKERQIPNRLAYEHLKLCSKKLGVILNVG